MGLYPSDGVIEPHVKEPLRHLPRGRLTFLTSLSLLKRFALTSLLVFLVLGFAIAYFLGQSVQVTSLAAARQTAYDTLHRRLLQSLSTSSLVEPMKGTEYRKFDNFIRRTVLSDRTVRVKVWSASGTVIYSSDRKIVGKAYPISEELGKALHNQVASEVSSLRFAENRDDRKFGRLLEVYIPIKFRATPSVSGAFEVYQDYAPVAAQITGLQHDAYALTGGGLLVLYLMLFGVVRTGSNTIRRQQRQLRRYTDELEESYQGTIASLAAAVDARDSSTELHAKRVTELATALGAWIKLPDDALCDLERGALLHDVGKIGISDSILLKPDKLTSHEWEQMRQHPLIGYRMLGGISFLKGALPVVLHHHEKWDGSGYPHGLKGEAIPLDARLFAVVDAYDAITADRPYRRGSSHSVAMNKLRAGAGTHFDPAMVSAFEGMVGVENAAEVPAVGRELSLIT